MCCEHLGPYHSLTNRGHQDPLCHAMMYGEIDEESEEEEEEEAGIGAGLGGKDGAGAVSRKTKMQYLYFNCSWK